MSNVSHQPSIQSLNKTNGQTQNHNSSHDINQSTTNDGHADSETPNNTDIIFTLAYDQQESFDVCNGTSVIPSHVQPIRKDVVDFSVLSPLCGPPRAGDRIAYKVTPLSQWSALYLLNQNKKGQAYRDDFQLPLFCVFQSNH